MNYYLQVNSLIGCPYSIEVENLLEQNNISNEINKINFEQKNIFKTSQINTFPQIFLKKYNSNGSILLGGNSDFQEILNLKSKSLETQLQVLSKKYPKLTKKVKLRIIELFNT